MGYTGATYGHNIRATADIVMTHTEPKPEEAIVHIVDDDGAVRYALGRLLESVRLKYQAYESGDAFVEQYTHKQPGCLVLDMRMPGMSGLEVQRTLNERNLSLPIIVITGHGDTQTGVQAMKNGAFDFIQKPFNDQHLLDIVHAAIQSHTEQWAKDREKEFVATRFASLSERERDVLDGILNGEPNKRIAGNLNLSEKTIEYHRANIMKKMDARSLADLIKKTLLATQN